MQEETSVELQLSAMKEEYKREQERKSSFNTRAGLFIGGMLTILTMYIREMPFDKLKDVFQKLNVEQVIGTIIFIFLVSALTMIVFAFICFIKVVSTRDYKVMPINNLIAKENIRQPKEVGAAIQLKEYYNIIIQWREQTEKQEKLYSRGLKLVMGAFIIIIILIIILKVY